MKEQQNLLSSHPQRVKIYTDGGCDKNPGGTGGWAFRVIDGDQVREMSGRVENTTNNRMEMLAAIKALETLPRHSEVTLFSDSQYLVRGMTEWMYGWRKRNWTLKDGSPVKNAELWQKLYELSRKHDIEWQWVRGHADDLNNNRVDKLVKEAIKGKIADGKQKRITAKTAVPVVKVNKRKGKPVSVTISLKSGETVEIDQPTSLKIEAKHLQKLVEDLVNALRDIEES